MNWQNRKENCKLNLLFQVVERIFSPIKLVDKFIIFWLINKINEY